MNKLKNTQGFTLLELMITLGILSTLMIFSNQSIQNGIRAKLKIQDQVESMSQVRDALRIMEMDINLTFHYRDIETEFKQTVQQKTQSSNQTQNQELPPPLPPPGAPAGNPLPPALLAWLQQDPERKDPTTQFMGSGEELYFATMNTARLQEDLTEADFIKVGYYLSSCKKAQATSKCLMRSSGSIVEGDINKVESGTVLLENVTEFKLRYIGKGKQDWVNDWNTKTGDAVTKNNFPEAVEISLTTTRGEGEKKKKISMQIVAALRFPNNKPPAQQQGVP